MRNSKLIRYILLALFIFFVGGFFYYWGENQLENNDGHESDLNSGYQNETEWKTYRSDELGIEFQYPVEFVSRNLEAEEIYPVLNYEKPVSGFIGGATVRTNPNDGSYPVVHVLVYDGQSGTLEEWISKNPHLIDGYGMKGILSIETEEYLSYSHPAGVLVPSLMYLISKNGYHYQIHIDSGLSGAEPKVGNDDILKTSKYFAPSPKPVPAQTLNYKNSDFEIMLTNSWKGYKVTQSDAVSINFFPDYIFCVPTTSVNYENDSACGQGFAKIMNIHKVTADQWEYWQRQEGPKPGYLGQKGDLIFGFSIWQDPPNDLVGVNFDLEGVIASFRIIE